MGIFKGHAYFLGVHLPGVALRVRREPLDSHSVGLFCPSNLASTTHGTFELLIKKCALTPPGPKKTQRVGKAVNFSGEKKTKETMNDRITPCFRGESWFFV